MKNIFFLLLIFQIKTVTNSQSISGLYTFFSNGKVYYVNFKNSKFQLFSLKQTLEENKQMHEIDETGNGTYIIKNNKFYFHFDSLNGGVQDYSMDELTVKFTSDSSSHTIHLSFKLAFSESKQIIPTIKIETNRKTHMLKVKNGSINFSLNDSSNIKKITLSMIGYEPRELPFSNLFNKLEYEYNISDKSSIIKNIQDKEWSWKILNFSVDYIRLTSMRTLAKMKQKDISFLENAASKNEQLLILWKSFNQ